MTTLRFTIGLVAMSCLVGCGSGLPSVTGTITLDGDPLPGAKVTFSAQGKPLSVGQCDDEGWYSIDTGDTSGMEAGSYRVTVIAFKSVPSEDESTPPSRVLITPEKYNNAESSELTAEVKEGSNQFDFDLSSQ